MLSHASIASTQVYTHLDFQHLALRAFVFPESAYRKHILVLAVLASPVVPAFIGAYLPRHPVGRARDSRAESCCSLWGCRCAQTKCEAVEITIEGGNTRRLQTAAGNHVKSYGRGLAFCLIAALVGAVAAQRRFCYRTSDARPKSAHIYWLQLSAASNSVAFVVFRRGYDHCSPEVIVNRSRRASPEIARNRQLWVGNCPACLALLRKAGVYQASPRISALSPSKRVGGKWPGWPVPGRP